MFEVTGKADIAHGRGAPVTPNYKSPFPFTGKIHKVTVNVGGELIKDEESKLRRLLARQ